MTEATTPDMTWVVRFVVDVPEEASDPRLIARAALPLFDELAPIADVYPSRVEFEIETVSDTVDAAAEHVTRVWKKVASGLDLAPEYGSIQSIQSKARAEADTVDLLGVAELALILAVSKTRARQLAANADFPHPVTTLAATPVWKAMDVRRYAEQHGRHLHA